MSRSGPAGLDGLDRGQLVRGDEDGEVSIRGRERGEVDLAVADGRQLASASGDKTVKLWNVA